MGAFGASCALFVSVPEVLVIHPARLLLVLAVSLNLFGASPVRAQSTGSVAGQVLDESGRALPSAQVGIAGTPLGRLTDANGRFSFARVPAGPRTVEVSFIGYESRQADVTVQAGETAELTVTLPTSSVELDAIVVYGEASRGQAKALQRQKTSLTITNVVSEELFNRFPDRNAAETIRRLPGISMDRDQGEGEFVQIRGVDQEFNSLTVNGIRIPAPDEGGGNRSVGLDLINNSLLGEVEVVKALTPDMDADAVGGVVNFGLRDAPVGGIAVVNAGAGLNQQTSDFDTYGRQILDASAVFGDRWNDDRFGLLVDGAYYSTSRNSKLRELEYDDDDGAIDDAIVAQHTNDYDLTRQRFGFSTTMDVQPSPGNQLYATGSYNVYLDDEVRREVEYILDDAEETRETRNRLEDQRVALFMAGGEHDFGAVRLDYKGAWIRATEELPDRTYLRYQRTVPLGQFSNDAIKEFDGTTTFTGAEPPELNRIRWDDMIKRDADLSGQVNLEVPFTLGNGQAALQFGGKLLRKDVSYERVRFQMTDFTQTQTLAEGTFGFEDVRYDGADLQPLLTTWGDPRNITGDYDATEDVAAVYGMATLPLGERVTLLAGGRYERTSSDYTQPNPETQSAPLTGSGEYGNFLPSAHLTIRPDDASNLRLAYSTGLARASYEALVPRRIVDEEDRTISYGNPDLEPRTADNFDVMYERYTSGLGVVTLGAFYKRFRAFHTSRVFQEDVGGVAYTATQTVMGDGTASYTGLEVSFNRRLGFVSSALQDFSLFGNYNYTRSEGEVNGRELPLTNSPEHTANLSLLYDNGRRGLSFVVAANYRDDLLIGVGNAAHRDVYFDDEFHLDFSVTQTLSERLAVSAKLNGITAQQEREVLGKPGSGAERILQWEEYGPYATVNVRYSFR